RGNWVREGFLYVPDKGAFLTKNSPVMANAKQATDCHRSNREFYLDDSQVESALANSVNIANTQIPTNRFADDALTNFAFGKNAKAYGEFLGKNGIDSMQVYLASSEYVPFAKQAWLCRISSRGKSGLSGSVRSLDFDDAIRGVREPGIEQE
ncbi:MAG TPA: hypothetical protein VI544_01655, partial [Candidatus Nanoarchaeia archaeon]|nr:hypothetical protein [Candidatus Nanoarchaeia archaeon]